MRTRKPSNKQPQPVSQATVTASDIEDPREAVASRGLREVADPLDDLRMKHTKIMRDAKEL